MRADRMISALLLMQSRGRITAGELASELEISVSTARRDLEALAQSGVPVYPQPGRRGGWSLVGGARTDLSGLTAGESRALFALLGASEDVSSEASSALRKLVRALPGPFRGDAEAAAAATHRDSTAWGELTAPKPAAVETVQQAIIDRVRVRFDYTRRTGEPTAVTASPLGLVAKSDRWYLVAARPGAAETRTYRMDRARDVEVLTEPAEDRPDFNLTQEWQRISAFVDAERSRVRARLRLPRRHLWVLRDHFGSYLRVLDDRADATGGDHADRSSDETIEVSVAAHTARSIAEQLAGWGGTVQVLEPESVRRELAAIGAELFDSYSSPPGRE